MIIMHLCFRKLLKFPYCRSVGYWFIDLPKIKISKLKFISEFSWERQPHPVVDAQELFLPQDSGVTSGGTREDQMGCSLVDQIPKARFAEYLPDQFTSVHPGCHHYLLTLLHSPNWPSLLSSDTVFPCVPLHIAAGVDFLKCKLLKSLWWVPLDLGQCSNSSLTCPWPLLASLSHFHLHNFLTLVLFSLTLEATFSPGTFLPGSLPASFSVFKLQFRIQPFR